MLRAATLALRQILSAPLRRVLFKSLALTLGLLALVWWLLAWLAASQVTLPYPWLDTAFSILSGIGLVIGLGFLIAPVTALFAGIFLDDVAEIVERMHYPEAGPGRAVPLGRSSVLSMKFLGLVLLVNAVALPLVLILGFGLVIFLLANAYLLGREYFQLAALRFHDEQTVRRLRLCHGGRLFGAGLIIAGFLAVPFLNLLTPLFATAFMVHVHQRIAASERRPGGVLA
jgi:CysZ protein